MVMCKTCSEPITGSGKKYCSLSCSNRGRLYIKKDRSKICEECQSRFNPYDLRAKFCSSSCSAKFNNRVRGKRRIKTHCTRCSAEVSSRNKTGFCSTECRRNTWVDEWIAGIRSGTGKYQLTEWVREYVLDRAGRRCQAIDSRTGLQCIEDRILQVDHIDGNWTNDRPENLRAICPTCHALTPTYGALNKGRGRTWKNDYHQFVAKP